MVCILCFSSNSKLYTFQGHMDNDTFKRIVFVLPDFSIPEFTDLVSICATCLEEVSFFYTIKKASLQNSCRLKQFDSMLKGTNNFENNEIKVILNSDKVSTQSKHHIKFKVNPNSKYLLSSEDQDVTPIKEEGIEYVYYSQQLVNEELNHLQDDSSDSSSKNTTEKQKNSHMGKFTEKDSNITSTNSRHEDQPKTQRGNQNNGFKCSDCQKTFTYRSQRESHSRAHTGEKPFKCTTCKKTFSQRSSLKTHKLTHTGEKPHKCDVCQKTFNDKSNLKTHKRIHNNERPHKCAVCNKGFTTSSNLTKHMLTHTGEKPHQCHLCEYKCTQADTLKRHIRYHTGEKPYSCKHCDKSFITTNELKQHNRKLHINEDSD